MSRICQNGNENQLAKGNDTYDETFYEVIEQLQPPGLIVDCLFSKEEDVLCEKILTPIITDQGVCYSFNLLDRNELYRDHVVHYKHFHSVANYSAEDFNNELFTYTEQANISTYPKRALFSGIDNSFDLILASIAYIIDPLCSYYEGFRILIHSPLDIPRMSKSYFRIPLNRAVVAAVYPKLRFTSKSIKHLSPEKRQCYWRDERYLSHFKLYTQSNCLLECLTNYTLSKCGCVDFYMPREKSTPICGTKKFKCMKDADHELQLKDLESKLAGKSSDDHTYCDCKPSCTELKFDVEVTHSQLPWKKLVDALGLSIFKAIFADFSFLSIYLKEEEIMGIEQNELYGISDLIANFGGLLGLFTGFSLISLIEIIYCLTLKIFYNKKLYGSWAGPEK